MVFQESINICNWLSNLPIRWKKQRLKYVLSTHFGGCWGEDLIGDENDLICIRIADFDYANIKIKNTAKTKRHYTISQINNGSLNNNDLILEKSGGGEKTPVGRVVSFSSTGEKTMFANFSECLRPKNDVVDSKYLALCLKAFYQTENIKQYIKQTTGIQNIDISSYLCIEVPVPPRDEQDQIVRFLDWKVSTVNKLINAKRQEIKSLVELKRSMVSSVVTRGRSQNVPMKYSGVKWLGNIPAHWDIVPLCAVAKEKSICDCVDLPLLSVYLDEGVILFSEKEEKRTNVTSKDLSKYQRVDPGDFVLNNQQAWRGSVGVSNYTGIVSPAYIVASLDDTLDRNYANYLLRSRKMVDQYLVISRGVGSIQRNIYWTSLKRVIVPVPPKDEQKKIVLYLEESDKRLRDATDRLMKEIETLEEYKTKLIADVVTGKIDVRNIEIPEYEFVEEIGIEEDEDATQDATGDIEG